MPAPTPRIDALESLFRDQVEMNQQLIKLNETTQKQVTVMRRLLEEHTIRIRTLEDAFEISTGFRNA